MVNQASNRTGPSTLPDFEIYTVKRGDTLADIAAAHGIADYRSLLPDNKDVVDPNVIQIGDQIRIPKALVGQPLATPGTKPVKRDPVVRLPIAEKMFAKLRLDHLPEAHRNAFALLAELTSDAKLLADLRDALDLPKPDAGRGVEAIGGKALFALVHAAEEVGYPLTEAGLAQLRADSASASPTEITEEMARRLAETIIARRVSAVPRGEGADALLFSHEPNGASRATAVQDALARRGIIGVGASWAMADNDVGRVFTYLNAFNRAAEATQLPPWLLAAIASRETRAKPDAIGDEGHAHGMMQVNDHYHKLKRDAKGRHTIELNVLQGAKILAANWAEMRERHPDWTETDQLRAAVAAYNTGADNVRSAARVDRSTTGTDYSEDVLARADYFRMIWPRPSTEAERPDNGPL